MVAPELGEGGASVATVRPVELATDDAVIARRSRAERAKLRRELSRLDTILFLISAMVVVDTIGAIAIGGGQAFTWLVVLFAGALTSLLHWAGTPMWLGGAVTVAAISV
jgi:hypothetical protein